MCALFLGTKGFADRPGNLANLGITHRLSCLLTKDEEHAWEAFANNKTDAACPPLAYIALDGDDDDRVQVARCPMVDEPLFTSMPEALGDAISFCVMFVLSYE